MQHRIQWHDTSPQTKPHQSGSPNEETGGGKQCGTVTARTMQSLAQRRNRQQRYSVQKTFTVTFPWFGEANTRPVGVTAPKQHLPFRSHGLHSRNEKSVDTFICRARQSHSERDGRKQVRWFLYLQYHAQHPNTHVTKKKKTRTHTAPCFASNYHSRKNSRPFPLLELGASEHDKIHVRVSTNEAILQCRTHSPQHAICVSESEPRDAISTRSQRPRRDPTPRARATAQSVTETN